jgi:hypothetical protein
MLALVRHVGRLFPLGVTIVAAGCYDDHPHCDYQCSPNDGYYGGASGGNGGVTPGCISGVTTAPIDAERYLELDPGYVGVSVEYLGAGAWRFAMACDTVQPTSGVPCNYDMTVSPVDGSIGSFAPESLEASDSLRAVQGTTGREGVNLTTVTDYDIDAFTLEATPGSTLEINLTLDGQCASPFMFWLEDGNVVSDPHTLVDLTPSAP